MVVIRNGHTDKELIFLSVMKRPSSFSQISLSGNFAKSFAKIEESIIRNTLIINTLIMFFRRAFSKISVLGLHISFVSKIDLPCGLASMWFC